MTFHDQSERITALEYNIGAALDSLKARDGTKDKGEQIAYTSEYRQYLDAVRIIVDQETDEALGETWYLLIWSNKKRPRELASDLGRHKALQPPHSRKSRLMY